MKKITLLILLFCSVATFAQIDRSKQPKPGPAPEINLKDPVKFALRNGLKVMVVENHKLPRVSVQLILDNPPFVEGNKAGVSGMLSGMLGKGTDSISKDDFNEEVDYLGARINFNAQSASASSLSKYFPRILELMAKAALSPNFTQEDFDTEKAKLITNLKSEEKDVKAIASRVQRTLAYGKDHPYGEFVTEESINNLALADVKKFYSDYFVPANAYLVIIGDVNFEETKELVETHFTPWTKATPPSFSFTRPLDPHYTQVNFVDVPNAVQSEVAVENLVDLKMSDKDYFAALLANQILGGGAQARLFLNLREDKAFTYGSYSRIGNNRFVPSTFKASASVRNVVTDSAIVEILKEVDKMITTPVTNEELANAKAKYIGNFVMAIEQPETMARYAINLATENLPKDFYKNYLENINAVTIADVQNAAKKYFSSDKARIVVTGKGSEVVENLEKLTFKGEKVYVKYFDTFANEIEKPDYNAETPEGVTAKSVIEAYIKAIGGNDNIAKVNSLSMVAEAEMQGMKLNLTLKKATGDKFMQDVMVMGNSMSKQVLNGDSGYAVMRGQRKDFNDEELAKTKEDAALFPELNYLNKEVTLDGIETVNGKKAYKIKVSDAKTVYFNQESGLKVQEVQTQEMMGQQMTSTTNLSDYTAVNGVLFPYTIAQTVGPQSFTFKVTDLKVNEGVSDADFE